MHLAERLVESVLLGTVAPLALLDEHLRERLRFAPALGPSVLLNEGHRRFLAIGIRLDRELPCLDGTLVLAQHLVADLAELDEELRAGTRRRRVRLLLLEVARRSIPVRLVDRNR